MVDETRQMLCPWHPLYGVSPSTASATSFSGHRIRGDVIPVPQFVCAFSYHTKREATSAFERPRCDIWAQVAVEPHFASELLDCLPSDGIGRRWEDATYCAVHDVTLTWWRDRTRFWDRPQLAGTPLINIRKQFFFPVLSYSLRHKDLCLTETLDVGDMSASLPGRFTLRERVESAVEYASE